MRAKRSVCFFGALLAAPASLALMVATVEAATIGAGPAIPHDAVDTAGQIRTNVDQSFTATLAPGTYDTSTFSFAAGQTGAVTPFVAIPNGADNYRIVALGDEVTVAATGTQSLAFGGSSLFSITTNSTVVHAGITNPTGSQNPVYVDLSSGSVTDHDNSFPPITSVGQTVNDFSNPNLNRTYAFSIDFAAATPQRVGAGIGIPHEALDGAGPRTNVDEFFTRTLQPGIYVIPDWEYAAGQSGDVTPFAATLNAANDYQVIAIGDQVSVAGPENAVPTFGRSNTFVVSAPTTIYGGITNPAGGRNPVFLDDGTTTTTDHDGSPTAITGIDQAVNGFSNPNLGRTYAFALNIDTRVPLRVGADIDIPHDTVDSPGGGPRMNVDDSFTITLDPGTYLAADFSFSAGQDGQVTPFLAILSGSDYELIALGDTVTVPDETINQTVSFGGDAIFTLTSTTTIYPGITNPAGSDNPIFLDNASGFTTDHDGTPTPLTGVGQLLPLGGFSNQNLGRTYAFSVGILVIPEPSTFLLAGLGLLSLVGLGRRRRTIG